MSLLRHHQLLMSSSQSGGGGTAYRYFRMRMTNRLSATGPFELAEMEYRSSIGGPDETGSGAASSSSQAPGNVGPEKVFDDDPTTFWRASSYLSFDEYVQYDLGAGNSIVLVQYLVRAAPGTARTPTEWEILGSNDAAEWTMLDSRVVSDWTTAGGGVGEFRVFTL